MTKHETPDTHITTLIPQNEETILRSNDLPGLDFLDRALTRELGGALLLRLEPRYASLAAKEVHPLNFRLGAGAGVVLGAAPRIGEIMPEIKAATSYREDDLRDLHDVALASAYAATDWQNRFGAGGPVQTARALLIEEGKALRVTFAKQARTFGLWEVLTPAEVASVPKGGTKIATLADDLGAAVGLFERRKLALEPKAQIPWSAVARGQALSLELHRLLSDEEVTAETQATDRCRRLGLLLVKTYEVTRRVVAFTRADEGDADTIAPSIVTATRKRARRGKSAGATDVSDRAAKPVATPASEGGAAKPSAPAEGHANAPAPAVG